MNECKGIMLATYIMALDSLMCAALYLFSGDFPVMHSVRMELGLVYL